MFFKKKKLSLQKIHELYLILEHCLPANEEAYLLDEVAAMLEKAQDGTMAKVLRILNPKVDLSQSYIKLLVLFIQGLAFDNFFEYAIFVRGMKRHGNHH